MDLEQYIGCVIMYRGRKAIVTQAKSTYNGDYFVLRYLDEESMFEVDAFDEELMMALPDPEFGFIKRLGDEVVFYYNCMIYTLSSHPYEPCLYIRKEGELIRTLHNAFETEDLPELFAEEERLLGADGREYDREAFCKVLLAAISCNRPEMNFTFAANLSRMLSDGSGNYPTDAYPKSLMQ